MAKAPPSKESNESKELAELQAKLSKLQQQASGNVAQSPEASRAFIEQLAELAAQIAAMGDAVVKGDEKKRAELKQQADAIQSLLKHMPGMKG